MARTIKLGFGHRSFMRCRSFSWRKALQRTLLVAVATAMAGWGGTGYGEHFEWTNGAGSGLWVDVGNWSPEAGTGGPQAGDHLTLSTNLNTLAGNSFLALGDARNAASLTFVGPTAKYLWANAPTVSSSSARQLRLTNGIAVDAGSGPVFIGNAGILGGTQATGILAVRINADQTFVNFSSADLTFGTAPNTTYDAMTGVGNNGTNIGGRIGGHNSAGNNTMLTVNAASTGNIVFHGLIDNGGIDRVLSMRVNSDGAGTVYLNNTVQVDVGVEKGVLSIGNGISTTAAVLGKTVDVAEGAKVIINRPSTASPYGLSAGNTMITGAGEVEITGGGVVQVEAAQTYTGGTTVSAGTLRIVEGGSLLGDISIAEAVALQVARNNDLTLDGNINGGGRLEKTGGGTLALTGDSAFTGGISIAADGGTGTLAMSRLNVSQLIADSGPGTLAIEGAGTLDISIADGLGGLAFRLGAMDSSDLVTISAGTLALGEGVINFDAFTFTPVEGFGLGTYDLFAASSLTGSLGASHNGQIGGFDAMLLVSGGSLQLQVVPEPSAFLLAIVGMGAALLVWRRRAVRVPA